MLRVQMAAAMLSLSLLSSACVDDGPVSVLDPSPSASGAISDGSQAGGNSLFHWLAPIGAVDESTLDPIDTGLSPSVMICHIPEGTTPDDGFCRLASEGLWSAPAQLIDGHYETIIHIDEIPLEAGQTYRLSSVLDGYRIGFADLQVEDNASGLRNVDTGEYVGVTDDRTLPAKFHLADPPSFCTNGDLTECFRGTVTPEGGTFTVPSRHAGVHFPENALLEPVTLYIERIPVSADASDCLPTAFDQYEGCYRYVTDPELQNFELDVTVGQCIEPDGQAIDERLQLYKYDNEGQYTSPLTALPNAAANFLYCDDFDATQTAAASPTLIQRMLASGSRVLSPLSRLFAVARLHATDTGLGGTTDSFSRIGWVDGWEFSAILNSAQTADAGALLEPVQVRVQSTHATVQTEGGTAPAPIQGVGVLAELRDPSGLVLASEALVSDQNGTVEFRPYLGKAFGTYTLELRNAQDASPSASGSVTASQNDGRGSVLVRVIDANSNPVEDAYVVLSHANITNLPSAYTNAQGYSGLNDVPGDVTYDLRVSLNGKLVAESTAVTYEDAVTSYTVQLP